MAKQDDKGGKKGGTPAKGTPAQKAGGKQQQGGGKGAKGTARERLARGGHAGADVAAPPPRLRAFYQTTVRAGRRRSRSRISGCAKGRRSAPP
jgi:hypothetical protein